MPPAAKSSWGPFLKVFPAAPLPYSPWGVQMLMCCVLRRQSIASFNGDLASLTAPVCSFPPVYPHTLQPPPPPFIVQQANRHILAVHSEFY